MDKVCDHFYNKNTIYFKKNIKVIWNKFDNNKKLFQ